MTTTALAVAVAFNLFCSGVSTKIENKIQLPPSPVSVTYRIDLQAGRWCGGACVETVKLAQIEDRKLSLISQNEIMIATSLTINRESGALYFYQRLNNDVEQWRGNCERAPFTGFPPRKF